MLLELLLQRLDLGLDVLAHGLGQRVEHLGLDHLALVHRRHGEAGRRAQDGDVLALRLAVQRLAAPPPGRSGTARRWRAGAPGSPRPRTAPAATLRSSSMRADHALGQRLGARPCGSCSACGPVGVVEVVDVDPVGRRRRLGGLAGRGSALTAVLLPEAGGPSTKMLKSWLLMLAPNWMALSARSWPIRPVIGCSSSVVLKPSVAGSTTRRSSEASSGCGLAATVVTSPLRPRPGASLLRALEKHAISHPCCCVRPRQYAPHRAHEKAADRTASTHTLACPDVARPSRPTAIEEAFQHMSVASSIPRRDADGRQSPAAFDICRGVARLLKAHGLAAVSEVALANGRRADVVGLSEQRRDLDRGDQVLPRGLPHRPEMARVPRVLRPAAVCRGAGLSRARCCRPRPD